jgi:hypothetical protein
VLLRADLGELRLVLTGGGLERLGPLPAASSGSASFRWKSSRRSTTPPPASFFPGLYERFWLPPLEAMASGVRSGAVNVGAIAEVRWEAAVQFDPETRRPSRTAPAKRSRWRTSCTTSASLRAARFRCEKWPGSAMPSTGRSIQTGLVGSWMCVSVSPS